MGGTARYTVSGCADGDELITDESKHITEVSDKLFLVLPIGQS